MAESNPREKWDLLWELMRASERLGFESARLEPSRVEFAETTADFAKAFDARQMALAKVLNRLEVADDAQELG